MYIKVDDTPSSKMWTKKIIISNNFAIREVAVFYFVQIEFLFAQMFQIYITYD